MTRPDPVLSALDEVEKALRSTLEAAESSLERVHDIRQRRAAGDSYTEIVVTRQSRLVVQVVTDILERLHTAGSRLRRAEARALHDEGMTMEEIAERFGVSRQRISALLRMTRHSDSAKPGGPG